MQKTGLRVILLPLPVTVGGLNAESWTVVVAAISQ